MSYLFKYIRQITCLLPLLGMLIMVSGCQDEAQIYSQIVPADPPKGEKSPTVQPASQTASAKPADMLLWQLPEGWREEAGNPPRIANLIVGKDEDELLFPSPDFQEQSEESPPT